MKLGFNHVKSLSPWYVPCLCFKEPIYVRKKEFSESLVRKVLPSMYIKLFLYIPSLDSWYNQTRREKGIYELWRRRIFPKRRRKKCKQVYTLHDNFLSSKTKNKNKNRKTGLTIKNHFLFFILKNKKYDIFKEHILVVLYYFYLFFRVVLKNNYINV